MSKLQVISSVGKMTKKCLQFKPAQKVGFVPTMGYLHEGHLSLVKKARKENDIVIVSIFVNPTQFGPKEDLSHYPRDLKGDLAALEKLGVDLVFTPTNDDIYPQGFSTYVEPTGIFVTEVEGTSRPGHFRGVATVVLKLFEMIQPTNAYFGQKDAQQILVVSNMKRDLNLPVKLKVLPTVREKDGFAMSSRNAYLNPAERKAATILYKALTKAKESFSSNQGKHSDILKNVIMNEVKREKLVKLEYIEIRHPESFEQVTTLQPPAMLLIAAKVGSTRLIDNFVLQEDNTWDTGIIL